MKQIIFLMILLTSVTSMAVNQQLIDAIINGGVNKAKEIINSSVDLNETGRRGHAPLHYAAAYGFLELVRLLIEKGVDVNGLSNKGFIVETPLSLAARNGHYDVVLELLDNKADPNLASNDKTWSPTPLSNAIRSGYNEIAMLLLDRGSDVNRENEDRTTPIFFAVLKNNIAMINELYN